MESKRMTNNLRWTLKSRAERIKFKDQNDKLLEEKYALSEEIYNAYYGEYLPLMEQFPEVAFNKKNYSYLKGFDSINSLELKFKTYKKVFESSNIDIDDPSLEHFKPRVEDLTIKEAALNNIKNKYAAKVHILLLGLSTTKQLVELMPEAEAWLTENNNGCSDIPLADSVAELRSL